MQDMTPLDWALRPLRKYATFKGRASRAEYWWYYLGTVIAGVVMRLFDYLIGSRAPSTILSLIFLVPWLAVTVRRLHDTNRSGWWLLALVGAFGVFGFIVGFAAALSGGTSPSPMSAIVGVLIIVMAALGYLVFMVLPGNEGPNDYGDDPYGTSNLHEVFA